VPVRANWFDDDVDLDAEVAKLGKPIQLNAAGELRVRLHGLIDEERGLYERGIECAVKDRSDTSCLACPLNGRDERAPLCEIGERQDRLLTEIAIADLADGGG
jgi:hypothetical protein